MNTPKERIYGAIAGADIDRIPCAPMMIRFAAARNGIKLRDYFLDGNIFAECQMKAAEDFNLDAILLASEPTRIAHDLGGRVIYPENGIPHCEGPVITASSDLNDLTLPDMGKNSRMGDLLKAVEALVKHNSGARSICGWADAPFAEACNLITVEGMMMQMVDDESFARKLLEYTTKIATRFLKAQIELGVDLIAIGDAAASLISPDMYKEFVYPYEKRIIDTIHSLGIPVKLHMCGANNAKLGLIAKTGVDILNVDQNTDIRLARETAPNLCFKGNLDPVSILLQGSPDTVYAEAVKLTMAIGPRKYILSGGCELVPDTPAENLRALVAAGMESK